MNTGRFNFISEESDNPFHLQKRPSFISICVYPFISTGTLWFSEMVRVVKIQDDFWIWASPQMEKKVDRHSEILNPFLGVFKFK